MYARRTEGFWGRILYFDKFTIIYLICFIFILFFLLHNFTIGLKNATRKKNIPTITRMFFPSYHSIYKLYVFCLFVSCSSLLYPYELLLFVCFFIKLMLRYFFLFTKHFVSFTGRKLKINRRDYIICMWFQLLLNFNF